METSQRSTPDGPVSTKDAQTFLRTTSLGKRFGPTRVLDDVNLVVERGTIRALVGQNGAGKSTLVKALAGLYPHKSIDGAIEIDGVPQAFNSLRDAEAQGIVLIPQELQTAPDLTIAENMLMGRLPGRRGLVDFDELARIGQQWLDYFGVQASATQPMRTLTAAEQRLAIIGGALSQKARLLILDEPTAAITSAERDRLFAHLGKLRDEGIALLFISHALEEIEELADAVTVLRNGRVVAEFGSVTNRRDELVRAMIGGELIEALREQRASTAEPTVRLSARNLVVHDRRDPQKRWVRDVSLQARAGEILGVYGLVGAGAIELAHALFGAWPGKVEGHVEIDGRAGIPKSPRHAIARGLILLAEDRQSQSVFPGTSIAVNLSAASIKRFSSRGIIRRAEEQRLNAAAVERLVVHPPRPELAIDALSGGNQQKVLLGRCLEAKPNVLILAEPTLGVDVSARADLYRQIHRIAEEGTAVVIVSSDSTEVASQCDRTIVLFKGEAVAEFASGVEEATLVDTAATGKVQS